MANSIAVAPSLDRKSRLNLPGLAALPTAAKTLTPDYSLKAAAENRAAGAASDQFATVLMLLLLALLELLDVPPPEVSAFFSQFGVQE